MLLTCTLTTPADRTVPSEDGGLVLTVRSRGLCGVVASHSLLVHSHVGHDHDVLQGHDILTLARMISSPLVPQRGTDVIILSV